MITKESAAQLVAEIHDFRPLEELARTRIESVRTQLEKEQDDLKIRNLQGQAEELRFWMNLSGRVNAVLREP